MLKRIALILALAPFGQIAAAEVPGVLEMQAKGVQIYACGPAGGTYGWMLKAPEAMLATADGRITAHHFAGPTWQAQDGSAVVGEVVASAKANDPADGPPGVPWLVLRAKSHSGTGAFDAVTYVVRSRTSGGLAPTSGCDDVHVGAQKQIPYTATYTLFGVR